MTTVVEEPTRIAEPPEDTHEGPFHIARKRRKGITTYWCGKTSTKSVTIPSAETEAKDWCQPCVKAWRNRFKGWRGFLYALRLGK